MDNSTSLTCLACGNIQQGIGAYCQVCGKVLQRKNFQNSILRPKDKYCPSCGVERTDKSAGKNSENLICSSCGLTGTNPNFTGSGARWKNYCVCLEYRISRVDSKFVCKICGLERIMGTDSGVPQASGRGLAEESKRRKKISLLILLMAILILGGILLNAISSNSGVNPCASGQDQFACLGTPQGIASAQAAIGGP